MAAEPLSDTDWQSESRRWDEILAAAGGALPSPSLRASPLWRIYQPLVAARCEDRDVVIGQLGQSLDGRIATVECHSHYINGPAAILHLHRLRALVDAVVVGVGTVVADDPRLTVRGIAGPQPARVVIDPQARAPIDARLLADDGGRRLIVCREACTARHGSLDGVEHLPLADLEPRSILAALRAAGLKRILVEGGAATLSRFLAAGCLDRLHLLVAPLIIGSGKSGLDLPAIPKLDQALRPPTGHYALPGGDVLFDCDLR